MRRNVLISAATVAAAAGLALSVTACDSQSSDADSPRTHHSGTVTTTESAPTSTPVQTTARPTPTTATPTTSTSTPSTDNHEPSTGSATGSANTQRSKIFQKSQGFDFLQTPGVAVPGGKFQAQTGSCSFGWLVNSQSESADRKYMVTAGHCGNEGERVYVRDNNGNDTEVGEIVNSTNGRLGNGADYALIDVTNAAREAKLPLSDPDFDGWQSQSWVAENKPRICRLGYRTGISCGNYMYMKDNTIFYEGIQDHGDSGGPVWAETGDGKRYAIGVASYGYDDDATATGAAALEPWMNQFDLQIYVS